MPKNLVRATTCLAAALVLSPSISAGAATYKTLFSFDGTYGSQPSGDLIADRAGNLYGTAYAGGKSGYGDVFELSPPAAGKTAWTSKVLVAFNGTNGGSPYGSLIADGAGNLYGTGTSTVFELSPPAAGKSAWKEEVLFRFSEISNGVDILAGVILDKSGNLHGTTERGGTKRAGTIFELSPPASGNSAWSETDLFSFNQADGALPVSSLIADGAGNLYGTTRQGGKSYGTVFEVSPPAIGETAWTEKVLFAFNGTDGRGPLAGLVADAAGNLYGTTSEGGKSSSNGSNPSYGTVFELSPPEVGKTAWTEKVLFSFNVAAEGTSPFGDLLLDKAGNLYGTTYEGGKGFGTVFELSPPAPGKVAWTEKVLVAFSGTEGAYPLAGLIADDAGNLYGTTTNGGKYNGGTVFEVSP